MPRQVDARPPHFWTEPFDWADFHGLREPIVFVGAALVVVALIALIIVRRRLNHVAHRRATTPDGPDADYREPA